MFIPAVHKAVKTARKVISKQQSHQTQRFKVFNEISMVIEDDTLVKRDRGRGSDEGDKGQEGRTYWNTEQGNYVKPPPRMHTCSSLKCHNNNIFLS